jgi:hypothetical protein
MQKKNKKIKKQKASQSSESAKEVLPAFTNEQPSDFGGLPDRDFKKNLGCG